MDKVFVIEADNNMDYSDHQNWFVACAATLEDAIENVTQYFQKQENRLFGDYYTPLTEKPVEQEQGSFRYKWDWDDTKWGFPPVSVYIYLSEVYRRKTDE